MFEKSEKVNILFETIKKFSDRTGLSYSCIRQMAMNGQLPYVKVGNRYMINVEEGIKALAAMTSKSWM